MASTTIDASKSTITAKAWEKTSQDTLNDTIRTARDMGQLRLNYSRLNMITTLSKNETEDWFSFKVTSRGKIRLTAVNLSEALKEDKKTNATDELEDAMNDIQKTIDKFKAQGLKVEIYEYQNNRQTLLASNDESKNKSKQYEAFEQMMRGEYQVKKGGGTYYVHVTTKDGKPVDDDTLYALQLQMGTTYKHDYVTQEQSVDHTNVTKGDIALAKAENALQSVASSSSILSAQGATDLLSAGYTNMATIKNNSGKSGIARIFNILA